MQAICYSCLFVHSRNSHLFAAQSIWVTRFALVMIRMHATQAVCLVGKQQKKGSNWHPTSSTMLLLQCFKAVTQCCLVQVSLSQFPEVAHFRRKLKHHRCSRGAVINAGDDVNASQGRPTSQPVRKLELDISEPLLVPLAFPFTVYVLRPCILMWSEKSIFRVHAFILLER